jgi:membrane associated rhomboid family serine protease
MVVEIPGRQFQTPQGIMVEMQRVQLPPGRGQVLATLLTHMFLHGGWLHLLGNMWFLWIFGNNVEDRLGPVLYLLFYLGGGLLATGTHWLLSPDSTAPLIGASGAVAAILGAYAITWPWARVETFVFIVFFFTIIELPALVVLGIWFFMQVLEVSKALGLSGSGLQYNTGVAWWAHVGGFVAGVILMPYLSDLAQAVRRIGRPQGRSDDPYRDRDQPL